MADNQFYRSLTVDLAQLGHITLSNIPQYTNTSAIVTLTSDSLTETKYFKFWVDQTASGSTAPAEATWQEFGSEGTKNVTVTFSVEGANYIHFLWMDEVGNIVDTILDSSKIIYDLTAPTFDSLSFGTEITTKSIVEATIVDPEDPQPTGKTGVEVSGLSKVRFTSSDFDTTFASEGIKEFDYSAGTTYQLTFKANVNERETKTVQVVLIDNAGNISSSKSTSIIVYTGGADPVILLKDADNAKVLSEHTNVQKFTLNLKVLTVDASAVLGYKVYGDFGDSTESTTTEEPADFTTWPTGETLVTLSNKYFKDQTGIDYVRGKSKLAISTPSANYDTKTLLEADLANLEEGNFYSVTVDETRESAKTVYKCTKPGTEKELVYFGIWDGTSEFAISTLGPASVHYSTTAATIEFKQTGTETAYTGERISDKTDHNSVTFDVKFTDDCGYVNEGHLAVYKTSEAATAGTYVDNNVNKSFTGNKTLWSSVTLDYNAINTVLKTGDTNYEGPAYVVCYAKDLCGNWGKSSATALLITCDLSGPTGTITVNQYYKEATKFSVTATDPAGGKSFTCWVNNTAIDTVLPAGATAIDISETGFPTEVTVAQTTGWDSIEEGLNTGYCHIKWVDKLDNVNYVHSDPFTFDKTAPNINSFSLPTITNVVDIQPTSFTYSDKTSGVATMSFTGDIVQITSGSILYNPGDDIPISATPTIKLSSTDGTKTVKVKIKDNAGNESTETTATTVLDTIVGTPIATFADSTDTTEITKTKYRPVIVRLTISGATAETITDISKYKIWGDIDENATEPEAWTDFTLKAGTLYCAVPVTLTENEATADEVVKKIYGKVKDIAGNEKQFFPDAEEHYYTITLDTKAPSISMGSLDYSKISDKTSKRRSGSVEVDAYCNEVKFSFNADSKLSDYKVCINARNQTADGAEAIPTTAGSTNMSGSNLEKDTTVNCKIVYADLNERYKAITGSDFSTTSDTAIEIIIYGKDESGNWSAVHAVEQPIPQA